MMAGKSDTSNRGFASMDEEKQREIARKGGESVPDEKRTSWRPKPGARAAKVCPTRSAAFRRIMNLLRRRDARVAKRPAGISAITGSARQTPAVAVAKLRMASGNGPAGRMEHPPGRFTGDCVAIHSIY